MAEYPMPHDKLVPALIKFQAECPAIPKDKENPFFKNKDTGKKCMYADLATILDVTKEPRTKNGLAITQLVNGETLETYLFHESGQFLKSEMLISNEKHNAQGFGSGLTYARRYALSAILGIAADDDDDGNEAANKQQVADKTPTQPTTPANTNKRSPASPATQNNPCTQLQQTQINSLWQDLGRSEAQLKAQLKKDMSVDTVEELTGGQAAIVVAGILGLIKAKKEKDAKDKTGAAGGAEAGTAQ